MQTVLKDLFNAPVPVREKNHVRHIPNAEALVHVLVAAALNGDPRALSTIMKLLERSGRLNELTEEESRKYGVLVVPELLSSEEWTLLHSPAGEADRKRYRALIRGEQARRPGEKPLPHVPTEPPWPEIDPWDQDAGSTAPDISSFNTQSAKRIVQDPPPPVPYYDPQGRPLYKVTRALLEGGEAGPANYVRLAPGER